LVDQLLLVLKVAFVVLLYLFIWRIIRVASKDVQVGQESAVLAAVRPSKPRRPVGWLLVESSNDLTPGQRLAIDRELAVGRADRDMIEDLDSTNGTFVNGEPLHGIRPLADGDLVAVGQTQLRYEAGR
jgi:hypothetical protein